VFSTALAGGKLQLARRLRFPAIFCALAVLLCELISRPYANMGVCDDWPYILMAQHLAATGHIVYNGWATAMLGWQLYLAAAFIKLVGFSFTTVRMSTLLVAIVLAFVLQRTLVLADINERNATIGTLCLVLSPLYLMLSVTFMSDITGLFAVVLCLYCCLRALQSSTDRSTIAWLCFAVLTNAIFGTSRQIAWLGILVMVPSTLWLLRSRRRVLLSGAAAALAGALFIFLCLQWFKHQPYSVPEHLLPVAFPVMSTLSELAYTLLDVPFLALPIMLLFFPQIRKLRVRTIVVIAALFLGYVVLATYPSHLRGNFELMPMSPGVGLGEWNNVTGMFAYIFLQGTPPIVLGKCAQVLLTLATFGSLVGLIASFRRSPQNSPAADPCTAVSWHQIGVLLAPFTLVYVLLLIPRAATTGVRDRYLLELLAIALLCVSRYYQERIQSRLPVAGIFLIATMATYSTVMVHNMFSLYRARVAIAAELTAAGVPDTSIDDGWEYNFGVELRYATHINESKIVVPAHAYAPPPPLPPGPCTVVNYNYTPHVRPVYSISYQPDVCYGPAPFAPTRYSRWPYRNPGTLYVVHYLPLVTP
jgi:hypothetical protein